MGALHLRATGLGLSGAGLPLRWLVLSRQSVSVAFTDYQNLLTETAPLLPAGSQVVLLAGRGFVDVKLFGLARDLGWSFRIRLKSSLWVYRANKPRPRPSPLCPYGQLEILMAGQLIDPTDYSNN